VTPPADGTSPDGEAADRDGIAPVTYLFGATPAGEPTPSAGGAPQSAPDTDTPAGRSSAGPDRASRRAENVSLNGLTRRNMSRWEIEKLLASRDLSEDVIAQEVERLEGVGLIDDAALAETLVRTQRDRKGLGRQALIAELRRRHIDQDIIDTAIETDDGGDAEQERANELAEKKARALASYDQETAKRRLTGFLMRKGYSSAVVQAATAAALGGRTSGVQFR
jgi:regulatory protein